MSDTQKYKKQCAFCARPFEKSEYPKNYGAVLESGVQEVYYVCDPCVKKSLEEYRKNK